MLTRMSKEFREAPDRLRLLISDGKPAYEDFAMRLRHQDPAFATTIARGSSDHAASYAAHLFSTINHRVTASLAPSLATLFASSLRVKGSLALAISQSGASPDIVAMTRHLRQSGALTAGLINMSGSILEEEVEWLLPQMAGEEVSVAATKTVLCSLTGVALISALWADDRALLDALDALPERIDQALEVEHFNLAKLDKPERTIFVIGRGAGLAIASEIALKFKETSSLPAMAFSPAELQHGPKAAIDHETPLIFLETDEPGGHDTRRLRLDMQESGHNCLTMGLHNGTLAGLPKPLHPSLDPIIALAAAYPIVERLALARGMNPDRPVSLSKVTRTV